MTPIPTTRPASAALSAAARTMRDYDVGDIVVLDDGKPCGIVTGMASLATKGWVARGRDATGIDDNPLRVMKSHQAGAPSGFPEG